MRAMTEEQTVPGSLPLGFLAGFFGGCIGLALVYFMAKGADTKKGAIYGFVAVFVLGIVANVAMMALG
jgi:hypothetical protein